jgi:hypothetical protein
MEINTCSSSNMPFVWRNHRTICTILWNIQYGNIFLTCLLRISIDHISAWFTTGLYKILLFLVWTGQLSTGRAKNSGYFNKHGFQGIKTAISLELLNSDDVLVKLKEQVWENLKQRPQISSTTRQKIMSLIEKPHRPQIHGMQNSS